MLLDELPRLCKTKQNTNSGLAIYSNEDFLGEVSTLLTKVQNFGLKIPTMEQRAAPLVALLVLSGSIQPGFAGVIGTEQILTEQYPDEQRSKVAA